MREGIIIMMEVQKYLKEKGLKSLVEEFKIDVREYEDRVVLNYDQIESIRFHPITDECRALILQKDTWKVLARSFDRFYNLNEGIQSNNDGKLYTRNASFNDYEVEEFDLSKALVQHKLDGSIITVYHDGNDWCASTRKMARAEGETTLGITFSDLFWGVANKKYNLKDKLNNFDQFKIAGEWVFIFELTSPENRIVTPYSEADITLIGGRWVGDTDEVTEHYEFRELTDVELKYIANTIGVKRPNTYTVTDVDNLIELVNNMPAMEEGVVLVVESSTGSHRRIKVKNAKYLAIAHLRNNGSISPRRILALVMVNDHMEFLSYFPEDKKYFDFVECEYLETLCEIKNVWEKVKDIEDQKQFALTMMPLIKYSFAKGVLFSARKNGTTIECEIKQLDAKKIAESMQLKEKFIKNFSIEIEDD